MTVAGVVVDASLQALNLPRDDVTLDRVAGPAGRERLEWSEMPVGLHPVLDAGREAKDRRQLIQPHRRSRIPSPGSPSQQDSEETLRPRRAVASRSARRPHTA